MSKVITFVCILLLIEVTGILDSWDGDQCVLFLVWVDNNRVGIFSRRLLGRFPMSCIVQLSKANNYDARWEHD